MTEFELIVKENLDVALLFTEPDNLKKKLKEIETEVMAVVPDISTTKGRKEIASLAFKVAKSKVVLDGLGKDLVSEWKIRAAKVDESRKYAREFLDSLKDRVRQPLTDWELVEEARIKAEAAAVKYAVAWDDAHKEHEYFLMMVDLKQKAAELEAMKAAQLAKEQADRDAEEARQAEIARIQQEEINKANQLAREKRIAEEATAKAAKDAEQKAERERREAEQRLIDAEARRLTEMAMAERKRLLDIQAEKDRAEKEKQAMIEAQAKKDRDAAKLLEIQKSMEALEKAEEEKRQKDAAHQKKINNEAWASLQHIAGVGDTLAEKIVKAIAQGRVANVFIKY